MTPTIEAYGLNKRFGKTQALDGLDLVAQRGQVVAVLGPNGAGKTTFVRTVATLLRPDEGTHAGSLEETVVAIRERGGSAARLGIDLADLALDRSAIVRYAEAELGAPVQILVKLRESHCLFLGHAVRDRRLRVLLRRLWGGQPIRPRSWAVQRDVDEFEKASWRDSGVDVFAADPADYLFELDRAFGETRLPE